MWGELSWGEFFGGRVVLGRVVFGASCPDPQIITDSFLRSKINADSIETIF